MLGARTLPESKTPADAEEAGERLFEVMRLSTELGMAGGGGGLDELARSPLPPIARRALRRDGRGHHRRAVAASSASAGRFVPGALALHLRPR